MCQNKMDTATVEVSKTEMKLNCAILLCALLLIKLTRATNIQPRGVWTKKSTHGIPFIRAPIEYVIIHHTASPPCSHAIQCQHSMRSLQAGHMRRGFRDIGYNFVIASDGAIYEGLGFGLQGEHTKRYNSRSIGIAFMGNYNSFLPSGMMLQRARALINFGVRSGRIRHNYKLIGHRQTKKTDCPGHQLFNEIKKWPRWSPKA